MKITAQPTGAPPDLAHQRNKNEQHITKTRQNGDETQARKSEIFSLRTEHYSHITTEVTVLPPSFDY
jgi:hypothetical protein